MNCYRDWASLWTLHTACDKNYFSWLWSITESRKRFDRPMPWRSVKLFNTNQYYATTTHNTPNSNTNAIECTLHSALTAALFSALKWEHSSGNYSACQELTSSWLHAPCICILFSCPMHSFAVLLFAYCRVHVRMYFVNNAKPHVDYLHGISHPIVCVVQYHSGRLWQSSQTNFHETWTLCIIVRKQKVILIPHLP